MNKYVFHYIFLNVAVFVNIMDNKEFAIKKKYVLPFIKGVKSIEDYAEFSFQKKRELVKEQPKSETLFLKDAYKPLNANIFDRRLDVWFIPFNVVNENAVQVNVAFISLFPFIRPNFLILEKYLKPYVRDIIRVSMTIDELGSRIVEHLVPFCTNSLIAWNEEYGCDNHLETIIKNKLISPRPIYEVVTSVHRETNISVTYLLEYLYKIRKKLKIKAKKTNEMNRDEIVYFLHLIEKESIPLDFHLFTRFAPNVISDVLSARHHVDERVLNDVGTIYEIDDKTAYSKIMEIIFKKMLERL